MTNRRFSLPVLSLLLLLPAAAEDRFHPYVEKFFASDDRFIRDTVLPNIEKHRRSDFVVTVATSEGKPAAGHQLSLQLLRHDFHFGCAPPREIVHDEAVRRAYFEVFEFGVSENFLKWSGLERKEGKPDYKTADAILGMFEERHLPFELHFATGYHPEWFNEKSPEEKAALQRRHALALVERYQDRLEYVQVYNEIWRLKVERAAVFFAPGEFFGELTGKFPGVKFGVSDCWRLLEPLPDPEEVKARFPGISFLAAHAHQPRRLWASPQEVYACFDPWIDSGIELHLTEFGIRPGTIEGNTREGEWTEELVAEYFVQTAATCFSHPACHALNIWGMGPRENLSYPMNRMIRQDGTLTAVHAAMKSLIKDRLTTKVEAEGGKASFRGFHGLYEATITAPDGGKRVELVELNRDRPKVTVPAPPAS